MPKTISFERTLNINGKDYEFTIEKQCGTVRVGLLVEDGMEYSSTTQTGNSEDLTIRMLAKELVNRLKV